MKNRLYSVLDRTAEQYGAPMTFVNDGVAKRSFTDAFLDEMSVFNLHPEHFDLVFLAEFDVKEGYFDVPDIKVVMTGMEAAAAARATKPIDLGTVGE
jgi:hypothetical protein